MKRGQIVAVCGAPGAGKSELLPYLVDQLVPWIVVDLDEILEADGTLLGVQVGGSAGEANWPAYEALWSRISDMMTRSGHSVVVLSQIPSVEGLSDLRVRSPGGFSWIAQTKSDVSGFFGAARPKIESRSVSTSLPRAGASFAKL